jgi:hypothetical protein
MSRKSKRGKRKPKKQISTGELLRRIEAGKRRKRVLYLSAIIVLILVVIVALYLASEPTPTGTLVIRVVDEHTGNPIDGAAITISGPYEATAQADGQGVHRFESIPAGAYTVTVSKEGYHVHPETVSVEAGQTTDHTVRLHTYH